MNKTTVESTVFSTINIVSRWDSEQVLFTFHPTFEQIASGTAMRRALEAAVASGANLRDANLRDANMSGANLRGANLRDANLRDANMSGANLRGANMSDADIGGANLSCANMSDADIGGANLSCANMSGANMSGTNMSGANLRGANMSGANMSGADWALIKADYFDVLLRAPREVSDLRKALIAGRVEGSTYEGECACLVGTIAQVRGSSVGALGNGIKPDNSRPIERFFLGIAKGDTPENNSCSALAVQWLDEFTALLAAAHGAARFQD